MEILVKSGHQLLIILLIKRLDLITLRYNKNRTKNIIILSIIFNISYIIGKGTYGGLAVDAEGRILGTRTDKGRSIIQVLKLGGGNILTEIDSHSSKLRRPSGIAVLPDNHLVVVDLGNDCIKKYRYW